MPVPFAASTCKLAAATAVFAVAVGLARDRGPIVKPPDGAWLRSESVEIIVKSAKGRLLLDGEPVQADEPFPGVFRSSVTVAPGNHTLRLESSDGVHEVRFRTGSDPGGGVADPFVEHPPFRTECTHCHSVSRRGRFRFSGGCQTCHAKEQFIQTHSHEPHELTSCGMCHDAHGSSAAKLLVLPRDQACKQCHN